MKALLIALLLDIVVIKMKKLKKCLLRLVVIVWKINQVHFKI